MHAHVDLTPRFVSVDDRADEEPVEAALRWLAHEAAKSNGRGTIVFGKHDQVRHISRAVGDGYARELRLGRAVGKRVAINAVWGKDLPSLSTPVVVMWPVDARMDVVERTRPSAICAVPTGPERIPRWLRAWTPQDLMAPDAAAPDAPTISNPVVREALKDLTLNVDRAFFDSDAKGLTIAVFSQLLAGQEAWDPEEIAAWATRNGWAAAAAAELADLTGAIQAGSKPRVPHGSPGAIPADAVERWRTLAASGA